FNPVSRMKLIEVVVSKRTSDEMRDRALAFARQIGKVPVLKQSAIFWTTTALPWRTLPFSHRRRAKGRRRCLKWITSKDRRHT
ncbi:MAG TPA: 3-hydroxyacyl-CoA dehydrogenase NAD-binding domain-containing protein, partial [Pyrinomonadaceae bacterium]|nr:3-hydroxyacyl-CoA dehydrogenase NAD-binding domain-containing protein [Pyrinomonadaceae bacterium]